MSDCDVLIVGGGPVGLTLAIDLGRRGVDCRLVDKRPAPAFLPKMERCNARTMEHFRRLGIADEVRSSGYPAELPMDVFIVTSLVEPPLVRHPHPSVKETKEAARSVIDGPLPLEPYQLISQYTLEPLLKSIAESLPTVRVEFGSEVTDVSEQDEEVRAWVRREDGSVAEVTAAYLVGCDGGNSTIRRKMGAVLEGDADVGQLTQALFKCDDLYERIPIGQGRHYHVADRNYTFLIVQDDCKPFTLHSQLPTETMPKSFEEVVGMDVDYETLYAASWNLRLMLVDRMATKRMFLAGDATHLVIPTGALGMNAGVGEAIDLGWKLAGTLQGWGGPGLLASYEKERHPIGARNVETSRRAWLGRVNWRSACRPELREDSEEGRKIRAEVARLADVEQRKASDISGVELGYRYVTSPIVVPEPGDDASDQARFTYTPTTLPGARLPHVWLDDGTSLNDEIELNCFTLIALRDGQPVAKLEEAFRKRGCPFEVKRITSSPARRVFERDLILVRPDLHVAWRGDTLPTDPDELAAVVTGNARNQ